MLPPKRLHECSGFLIVGWSEAQSAQQALAINFVFIARPPQGTRPNARGTFFRPKRPLLKWG